MPRQPFFGAPSSISLLALSVLSGSTGWRVPLSGLTLGNLHLRHASVPCDCSLWDSDVRAHLVVRHETWKSDWSSLWLGSVSRIFVHESSSYAGEPLTTVGTFSQYPVGSKSAA